MDTVRRDDTNCNDASGLFARQVDISAKRARTGAVTLIQRFGGALVAQPALPHAVPRRAGVCVDLAEQQIQRYEATGYAGVSIERLQAVVDALNVRVNEVLTLEKE